MPTCPRQSGLFATSSVLFDHVNESGKVMLDDPGEYVNLPWTMSMFPFWA
jgi:hypothetical protein